MMHSTWSEVTIVPTSTGPTFVSAPPIELRPVSAQPRHYSRWSLLLAVLLFWSLPTLTQAAAYTSDQLINDTNAVRISHGLSSLRVSPELNAAAADKAADMFAHQYFNHVSPSGQSPWLWFTNQGYQFTAAGENLAIDFIDGGDIVPAWMNSASHRQNILNPHYRDIGLAVVDGVMNGQQTTVVVQFFGSRQSLAVAVVTTSPTPGPATPQPAPRPVQDTTTSIMTTEPAVPSVATFKTVTPGPVRTEIPPTLNLDWQPASPAPQVAGVEATTRLASLTPAVTTAPSSLPTLVLATLAVYLAAISGAGIIGSLAHQSSLQPA